MNFRTLAVALGTAALLAIPASASAATPPVIALPDPASIAAGKTAFSWTPGPAGEAPTFLTISTSSVPGPDGLLGHEGGTNTLTISQPITLSRELFAGTYYFNARWRTAQGATTPESGVTPVQSFTIAPYLRGLKGSFIQYSNIPAFLAKGTFITNTKNVTVLCRVYNGKKIVSRQTVKIDYAFNGTATSFSCYKSLKVPERLDGKRLRFNVVATAAGKKYVANKFFRAK